MADYDASIRINTKVDNSDLRKIHNDIIEMEKKFGNLSDVAEDYESRLKQLRNKGYGPGNEEFDKLYIAWKNTVNAEKEYIANLDKMTDKGMADEAARVAKEQEKQAEAQRKIEAAAERNLQKENAKLEKQVQLETKMQAEAAEQQRLSSLKDSAIVSDERMLELIQRQAELKKYLNDLERAGVTAGYEQHDSATKELQQINSEINARKNLSRSIEEQRKGFSKLSDSSKKCFKTIQDGTKKSNGMLASMGTRLKGIALSLLIFNWITRGFNAMVQAMKEGFQNLAQYSDDYNQSISALKSQTAQFKNGLAAAFEPIVNMAIPYITQLVTWLNTAVDAVGQFLAVLQGKNTYTRAKKQVIDYAKSLDTASKAAKGALASFDDLNVLNKQESTGASGGGLTGADAFEEAEINPEIYEMLEKAKKLLKIIKPIVVAIGVALLAWEIAKFLNSLGTLQTSLWKAYAIILLIAGIALLVYKYFDMWENGVDWNGVIGYISGTAMAILALYILFGPLAAGIGMIIIGIAGLVLAFKDMCENGFTAENVMLGLVAAGVLVLGVFLTFGGVAALVVGAFVAVGAAIGALIVWTGRGEETLQNFQNKFEALGDFVKSVFAGDMEGAFDALVRIANEANNLSLITLEAIFNGSIKAINIAIDAMNHIIESIPDWVLGPVGSRFTIPTLDYELSLPRLAEGAVIQGGKPFAAILGDQKVGQTNIETPLPTMVQAFKQALSEHGTYGGGNYTFVAQLNGKTIYQETVRQDQLHFDATGRGAFMH